MKDETREWLNYADENLQSAKILSQNSQQAIEKYIKSYFIENGLKLQKTHNISSLNEI